MTIVSAQFKKFDHHNLPLPLDSGYHRGHGAAVEQELHPVPVLLNGSSLDDCGRLDDCLDKTGRILVFFLLKSRISHHEHSFPSLQPLAAYRTDAKQTNKNGNLSETCLN